MLWFKHPSKLVEIELHLKVVKRVDHEGVNEGAESSLMDQFWHRVGGLIIIVVSS
jgi:hypothetical protein